MVSHQHSNIYHKIAYSYLWPILDALFLMVAVGTYSYFFVKIKENRKQVYQIASRIVSAQSSNKKVRRNLSIKSFFMPGILVITFIIFIVIPDETTFFHQALNIEISEKLDFVLIVLFKFGYLSDAIVYIFLQKEIFSRAKIVLFRCK